ncbi:cephalotocin receptor 2-like [Mya arenaria]|uniref:cephalotocin receptor 2-like n=1 Tax=Mya arenaria TaxID=6604 RepID=UPI0022E20345|nr:cephalotocin receptor 2-like [Mya arenaria]
MDIDELDLLGEVYIPESSTQDGGELNVTIATYSHQDDDLFLIKVVVQIVILVLALFGNTCLFISMRRRKRSYTRMHVFIMHLCFADLLVAFFNILPQLIWEIVGEWKAGDIMCRVIKFLQVFVMYLSTYVLVLTALDRRRAICSPLLSHTWTYRLVHLSVGGAYLLSVMLSIPQAIIFKYQETMPGSGIKNCWVHFAPEWTLQFYITAFTLLVYIIPLAILIYAYGSIYYTIFVRHKQSKNENNKPIPVANDSYCPGNVVKKNGIAIKGLSVQSHPLCHRSQSGVPVVPRSNSWAGFTRAKLKTVKLTLVIILAYVGCWSPFFVSQLWWLYDENAPANNKALVIMLLLASLNSCCNPWIYMAFSGTLSLRAFTTQHECCGNRLTKSSPYSPTLCKSNRSILTSRSVTTTPLTPTPSTSKPVVYNPLISQTPM